MRSTYQQISLKTEKKGGRQEQEKETERKEDSWLKSAILAPQRQANHKAERSQVVGLLSTRVD